MTWSWQFERQDGSAVSPREAARESTWTSQGDAESWLGENWRALAEAGVEQVTLTEDERVEYGPMSLRPE